MNKYTLISCYIYLSVLKVCHLQIFNPRCPQYVPKTDFDIQLFLGKWYEIEKTQLISDPIKCIATTFSKTANGNIMVVNEGINRL